MGLLKLETRGNACPSLVVPYGFTIGLKIVKINEYAGLAIYFMFNWFHDWFENGRLPLSPTFFISLYDRLRDLFYV